MENQKCKYCGRELRPAPAWHDGELTYVGYFACPCNTGYMTENGYAAPGTPEHDLILKAYDQKTKTR